MACFMIGCTLNTPGADTIDLARSIQRLGMSRQCIDSVWIVASDQSAAEILAALRPALGPNDDLVVAELSGSVAWRGTRKSLSDGLREVLQLAGPPQRSL